MMELMVRDGWRIGSEEAPEVAGTLLKGALGGAGGGNWSAG